MEPARLDITYGKKNTRRAKWRHEPSRTVLRGRTAIVAVMVKVISVCVCF